MQQPRTGKRRNWSHRAVWTGRKLTFQGTERTADIPQSCFHDTVRCWSVTYCSIAIVSRNLTKHI